VNAAGHDGPWSPPLRASLPEIGWPVIPAPRAAVVLSLLAQFEDTQWWPPERIAAAQQEQLNRLLAHAWNTVPFYRRRIEAAGVGLPLPLSGGGWRRLPLLTRRDLQSAGPAMHSDSVPRSHGAIHEVQTSGSTGEPVTVRKTAITALKWQAFNLREHHWHRRDLGGRLASIRAYGPGSADPPDGIARDDWGPPANLVYQTGPSVALTLHADIAVQARWIDRHAPDYLLTYPSNLAALLDHYAVHGLPPPAVREVRTVGEIVSADLRAACRGQWHAPIVDTYSSQEVGCVALQCPLSGALHVQAESLHVEVLDEAGNPCAPGQIGRVVVTDLHNFAMPLIRYEMGDYAEVGGPCACGRGLPVLTRVIGRYRHMVVIPGGGRHWPLVGFAAYRGIAPIRQYQLVQRSLTEIEARFVADRPLTADEEGRLAATIREALGYPFAIAFVYFRDRIPCNKNGKFEEFISEVDGNHGR
jgi:phenylacetate-CoA ligase